MKKAFFLIFFVSIVSISISQSYTTALGVRFGTINGLTVKQSLGGSSVIEGVVTSRLNWRGLDIMGLYEIHSNLMEIEGLYWYYGGGAHLSFWNGKYVDWNNSNSAFTVIGVDGVLGIEYTLQEHPINFSVDWIPRYNLIGYTKFWGNMGGLSVRYVF
jgi:hypothetical protein